nr:MAG TPA: hypothetical protein [Caudoviricetes sp.]
MKNARCRTARTAAGQNLPGRPLPHRGCKQRTAAPCAGSPGQSSARATRRAGRPSEGQTWRPAARLSA